MCKAYVASVQTGQLTGSQVMGLIRCYSDHPSFRVFATVTLSDGTSRQLHVIEIKIIAEVLVSDGGTMRYLQSSIRKMESEHRRYFRYQLTLEAVLISRDEKAIPAQILNVSDGRLSACWIEPICTGL